MGDDANKFGLEKLVSVEKDIVTEPTTSSSDQTGTEVGERKSQRLSVVSGDLSLGLGGSKLLASRLHLEGSEVDEPERSNGRNGKGNTVGPLRSDL